LWAGLGWAGPSGVLLWEGKEIFLLSQTSKPAMGPTQPPVQWVLGLLCPG